MLRCKSNLFLAKCKFCDEQDYLCMCVRVFLTFSNRVSTFSVSLLFLAV